MCLYSMEVLIKWDFSQTDSKHCETFEAEEHIKLRRRGSKYKKFQGKVLELIVLKDLESCPERRQPAWPGWYMACDCHVNDFVALS